MNQLFGGKESDERSSPDLVQQLPIILQMNLNEQNQTMLIDGAIFCYIFSRKWFLGKKVFGL